jgi:hypothetical protein
LVGANVIAAVKEGKSPGEVAVEASVGIAGIAVGTVIGAGLEAAVAAGTAPAWVIPAAGAAGAALTAYGAAQTGERLGTAWADKPIQFGPRAVDILAGAEADRLGLTDQGTDPGTGLIQIPPIDDFDLNVAAGVVSADPNPGLIDVLGPPPPDELGPVVVAQPSGGLTPQDLARASAAAASATPPADTQTAGQIPHEPDWGPDPVEDLLINIMRGAAAAQQHSGGQRPQGHQRPQGQQGQQGMQPHKPKPPPQSKSPQQGTQPQGMQPHKPKPPPQATPPQQKKKNK